MDIVFILTVVFHFNWSYRTHNIDDNTKNRSTMRILWLPRVLLAAIRELLLLVASDESINEDEEGTKANEKQKKENNESK